MDESAPYAPALKSLEICAGAGGQALGLERAGFEVAAAVEIDPYACATLRLNRPNWNVIEKDVRAFDGHPFDGIDLLAAGVPCPPFSAAGHQLGADDERDLFPEVIRLVREAQPRAVMVENVRGLLSPKFAAYRAGIVAALEDLGYSGGWRLFQASDYGVPQLRPRAVLVALREPYWRSFTWPCPTGSPSTVGRTLHDLMATGGWTGAAHWVERANGIAPTLVGGSKKHGGPDLGPTRARQQWAALGVDGRGLADAAPDTDFDPLGMPRLTVPMVARLQGFPDDWKLAGGKTAQYRQIGNAFPPPVAAAVANSIRLAIGGLTVSSTEAQLRLFERVA